MAKYLLFVFLVIYCFGCSSLTTNRLPHFSYKDGLQTAKKVNCSSRTPRDCMACALQGEAANQPTQGVYAVAKTIMTRAKGNLSRICKVTKARRQFEGMRNKGIRKISKKIWGVTLHIVKTQEQGWTHFWAPTVQRKLNRKKPRWATHYEKRMCRKETIGDHIFFNTNQCRLDAQFRRYKTPRRNTSSID